MQVQFCDSSGNNPVVTGLPLCEGECSDGSNLQPCSVLTVLSEPGTLSWFLPSFHKQAAPCVMLLADSSPESQRLSSPCVQPSLCHPLKIPEQMKLCCTRTMDRRENPWHHVHSVLGKQGAPENGFQGESWPGKQDLAGVKGSEWNRLGSKGNSDELISPKLLNWEN